MTRATPTQRQLAMRLLAHTSSGALESDPPVGVVAAAEELHERLTHLLAPLIGSAGVSAIFARSVKLTTSALAPGAGVAISAVTGGNSPLPFLEQLDPVVALDAATSVYATFLFLLISFIGERLTMQLVQRGFPEIDLVSKEST